MTGIPALRRLLHAASVSALAAATPSVASAADRWTPVEGEAKVVVSDPLRSKGVVGATFACAERTWTLALQLAPEVILLAGPVQSQLTVGERTFAVSATAGPGQVVLPVAGEAIVALKLGTSAKVTVGDAAAGIEAGFALRGSRIAIETADPLCSKRDMSGYEAVALTPYSSYLLEAKELRKAEVELFRRATSSEPRVSATKSVLADGRSLLFVELCGSSWYYGASGCNIAIFARRTDTAEWRQVYDTEGSDLYLDGGSLADGWPGVLAVSRTGSGEEVRWTWSGDSYAIDAGPDAGSGQETAEQGDGGQ